jgi:hypothetical protein
MLVGIASTSAVQLATLRLILEKGFGSVEGSKGIIEEVISNVRSIADLDEGFKKIVIGGYVKSLEYSHSEYSVHPRDLNRGLRVYSGFFRLISAYANRCLHHPGETFEMIEIEFSQRKKKKLVAHNIPFTSSPVKYLSIFCICKWLLCHFNSCLGLGRVLQFDQKKAKSVSIAYIHI